MKFTPKELYRKLSAPLPDEALEKIGDTGFTGINPAYEIERLNQVFGIGAWSTKVRTMSLEKIGGDDYGTTWEAAVKCTLTVEAYRIHHEQYGGHFNKDKGDALKGAATDAFGKCCSLLGIGKEVYMGLKNAQNIPKPAQYTEENHGLQYLKGSTLLYATGFITHLTQDDSNFWLLVNGILCCIPFGTIVARISHDYDKTIRAPANVHLQELLAIGKRISTHAEWVRPKRREPYLIVRSILDIQELSPIQIPELKK